MDGFQIMNASQVNAMAKKIKALTDANGFYDKVREIVGYGNPSIFIEDRHIKKLQRIADTRFEELGGV